MGFVCSGTERQHGREYMQWCLGQRSSTERILQLTSAVESRKDVSVVNLDSDEHHFLNHEDLCNIERNTGTIMFYREIPDSELFAAGMYLEVRRGERTVMAKVIEALDGDSRELRIRLCTWEEENSDDAAKG